MVLLIFIFLIYLISEFTMLASTGASFWYKIKTYRNVRRWIRYNLPTDNWKYEIKFITIEKNTCFVLAINLDTLDWACDNIKIKNGKVLDANYLETSVSQKEPNFNKIQNIRDNKIKDILS